MHRSGTPNHSRPPSTPSTPNDDAAYNAALRGASLAFQRTPGSKQPSVTPKASYRSLDNGALIAATSASQDRSLSSSPPRAQASRLSQHTTGSSVQGGNGNMTQHTHLTPQSHLLPPPKSTMADPRSPSFIAATLAASRSGSPSPRAKAQSHQNAQQQAGRGHRKGSVDVHSAASSVTSLDIATDTSPIPSANALISMFERGGDDTDPIKKGTGLSDNSKRSTGAKPKLRPVTPPRALSPIAKHDTSPSRLASALAWEKTATPPLSIRDTEREHPRQVPTPSIGSRKRPPTPPPARSKGEVDASTYAQPSGSTARPRATTPPPKSISRSDTVVLSPQPRRAATVRTIKQVSSEVILSDRSRKPPPVKPKPRHPTSTPSTSELPVPPDEVDQVNTVTRHKRPSSSSSNDTFVSASSAPSTHPNSPRRGRSRPATPDPPHRPSATRLPTLPQRPSSHTNLPLESLTDAIVAGSLASSRMTPSMAASRSRPPTPPPARKQTPHMRQTLRKPPSKSDDEEDKSRTRSKHHGRRRSLGKLGNRNKHSHQEGSRKRWREEITPRERKRYEGVWASNRGYLLAEGRGSGDESELVANVVARDIWSRSRLPFDELSEVWDLVDRRGKGALDKMEFVVGMWLVDQRLRGRKIPRKVGDSVWGSAKGVKVLGPKVKH